MLVARELRRFGLVRSTTLRLRLYACLVLGTASVAGCRVSEPAPEPPKAGPAQAASRASVLSFGQYLDAVQEKLQQIERLEGKGLRFLSADTQRRGRHVRDGLASRMNAYVALLDRLASPRHEPTAAGLELIVRECLDLRGEFVDLARQYRDWHASLRDLEIEFSTAGAGREEFRRVREYVNLSGVLVELFSDSGDQIARHHETRLLRAEGETPALIALHFLVLERLGKGELDRHAEVVRQAWKRWVDSQGEWTGPAAALGVVAAGFNVEKRYRPVSLGDMTRVVETCLEYRPSLPDIRAMEASLSTIERVVRAEAGDETEPGDFRGARAVLRLLLARRVADPVEGMRLAAEAGHMNATLADDVEDYLREAGREILEQSFARGKLREAFDTYAAALEENNVPERHTLLEEYRRLVLERALVEADEMTRQGEFEEARVFVDIAFGLARGEEERRDLGEATREFYVSYARRLEEGDPEPYLSLCREMVERLPRDPTARKLLDRGHLLRLNKDIGDVASSFRRFSARELLAIYRDARSRVRSEDGVRVLKDYLGRIRAAWVRRLGSVDDPEECFRFAAEVGVLAGWTEEEIHSRSARALARVMTIAADEGDWPLLERSVTMWFEKRPLQPEPWNFQEIHIRLLSYLDGNDLMEDLARHLAYFLAAHPEQRTIARQFFERLQTEAPEMVATFETTRRAMRKTFGTDEGEDAETIVERGHDGVEDGGLVERMDGGEDSGPATEVERPFEIAGGSPAPGDRPRIVQGSSRPVAARGSSARREGRRHPAGRMLFVVEAAGCAFLALVLFLLTVGHGPCRFRWYALAALWMGVTAGSVAAF